MGIYMVQTARHVHTRTCLLYTSRFEVSPSIEESSSFTDTDWAELGNDFMQRMGLMNHQYIIIDVYKRQSSNTVGRRARRNRRTCIYWQTGYPFPGNSTGTTG